MFKSLAAIAIGSFMAMTAESLRVQAPNHNLSYEENIFNYYCSMCSFSVDCPAIAD